MSAQIPAWPWVMRNRDKFPNRPKAWLLESAEGEWIAEFPSLIDAAIPKQINAANLMLAAPDLLEALKDMLEVHGVRWENVRGDSSIPQSWVELSDKARAAIAKATPEAKP